MTTPQPQSLQVPELTEELDRIAEDYDRYLQFIPEQFCSMCESHGDVIVPNSEESSKEQYPWFCTECEDASEVINLRQMLIAEIEEGLALQRRELETEIEKLPTRKITVYENIDNPRQYVLEEVDKKAILALLQKEGI